MTPTADPPRTPRALRAFTSPLWGLWLAFAGTVGGCIEGVAARQIDVARALLAVLLLAAMIRLVARALDVRAHPFEGMRVRLVPRHLRRARRMSAAVLEQAA